MRLHVLNLIGVLVLAILCVAQWRHDTQLNLEINRLEESSQEQSAKLEEQVQASRGLNADLAEFKEKFTRSEKDSGETLLKLRAKERDARQLTAERDQLKSSVTNWVSAVTIRDERLKEANIQIRRLNEDLNTSIRRFNELATNYNARVNELNDLRTRLAKPSTSRQPEEQRPQ